MNKSSLLENKNKDRLNFLFVFGTVYGMMVMWPNIFLYDILYVIKTFF